MIRKSAHKQRTLGDLIDAVKERDEREAWVLESGKRLGEASKQPQEAAKEVEQGLGSLYTWEEVLQAQNIAYAQGWADAMYKNNSEKD